jgi:hypothetical protein
MIYFFLKSLAADSINSFISSSKTLDADVFGSQTLRNFFNKSLSRYKVTLPLSLSPFNFSKTFFASTAIPQDYTYNYALLIDSYIAPRFCIPIYVV